MSDNEVQHLKEGMTEIKADVKEILTMVNDMRVTLAGEYTTKAEKISCQANILSLLKEHEDKERVTRRWWAGFILSASGALMTLISYFQPAGK